MCAFASIYRDVQVQVHVIAPEGFGMMGFRILYIVYILAIRGVSRIGGGGWNSNVT